MREWEWQAKRPVATTIVLKARKSDGWTLGETVGWTYSSTKHFSCLIFSFLCKTPFSFLKIYRPVSTRTFCLYNTSDFSLIISPTNPLGSSSGVVSSRSCTVVRKCIAIWSVDHVSESCHSHYPIWALNLTGDKVDRSGFPFPRERLLQRAFYSAITIVV